MTEVNYQTRLSEIPIGSRVSISCGPMHVDGVLDKVEDDGVTVSWFVIEWQTVNSKQQEVLLRTSAFVPYVMITDYMVTR